MPPERDLFANFERMRRDIDERFGDVFERAGFAPRRALSPNIDVYYCGKPPRATVEADLAGAEIDDEGIEPGGGISEVEVGQRLPEGLPVLPLKDTVTFPDTLTPLAVGQERSVKLVNDMLGGERMLVMVASQNPDVDVPAPDDLYRMGVAGTVARMLKVPDGTLRI